MNEIEKMYENCNIKPKQEGYCDWDSDCPYPDIINNGCGNECPYWKYEDKAEYPPFTAEKQLNIIKFLGETRDFHTCGRYCTALNSEGDSVESLQDKFEESLAGLINKLWTDMSEEEKQQIKEILE